MHHIAKNGGTFFKQFLYLLDNDQLFEASGVLHDWDKELQRANHVPKDVIRQSDFGLIIIRNPIHRFLSVYFDKVYIGGGSRRPGMNREFFDQHSIDQSERLDARGHIKNCMKLAEWSAKNLAGKTIAKRNWHLVPQLHQLAQVHELNFRVLTLETFDWQLEHVLKDLVPEIRSKIKQVGKTNKSTKPVPKSEVLTPELKELLKEIYNDDFKVFRQVRQYWRDAKARESGN